MAESLKEVIAKLKSQKNSQASKPIQENIKPKIDVPAEIEEDEEEIEEDEEETIKDPTILQTEEKSPVKPSVEVSKEEIAREQQMLMEIEMLQNNGRYRAEMLHQLQEINRALVVIAGVLVDLAGADKK